MMNTTKSLIQAIPQKIVLLCLVVMLSSCGIYKINVQQGNYLEQKKIDQVQLGMTRNQVKYLLGTPMIADAFHNDRWDYVYQAKFGRSGRLVQRKVTVFFDGDSVSNIDQYGQQADDVENETASPIEQSDLADETG